MGTMISANHVSPSATLGIAAIAATTIAMLSGRMSAQAGPLRRSSQGGMPAPVTATSIAWAVIRKELAMMNSRLICVTCGVQFDSADVSRCPVCEDERQYVPVSGQEWTTLDALR